MITDYRSYTLCEKLVKHAEASPDAPALLYDENRETHTRTHLEVYRGVCAVRTRAMNRSETRIGLLGTNSWQWPCHAWGLLAAGKTVAMLDSMLPLEDMISAVSRTDLQLLIADSSMMDFARQVAEALPELVISTFLSDEELLSGKTPDTVNWTEGEAIFFTSGTSKNSKAVVTSTWAMAGQSHQHQTMLAHERGEVTLLPLPLHHSFGFAMLNFFYEADCPIFISSMKSMLRDVRRVQPHALVLVPSGAEFLLKKKALASPIERVVVSGAFCPEELAQRIRACGITVQNEYGSSELPCGVGDSMPEDEVNTITLHPLIQVTIASDSEILITDPFHFKEYYKDPEGTAEVLDGDFFRTGDAGYLDENGKLHIIGRKKNIILMSNGDKVLCTDVDAALCALPSVADGAVIYVNQELVACIAPEQGATEEQISADIAAYNQTQPYYRRIRRIWNYGSELPYTSSGKLHRSRLEREYEP